MQMAAPGARGIWHAGQGTPSASMAVGMAGISGSGGSAGAAMVARAGARAACGCMGTCMIAVHLHLAFLPAISGFQGYWRPHDAHEKLAPPAMRHLRFRLT